MQTNLLQMDFFEALSEPPAVPSSPTLTLVPAPPPVAVTPTLPDHKLNFPVTATDTLFGPPYRDRLKEITDAWAAKKQELRDAGIYETKFRIVFDRPMTLTTGRRKSIVASEATVRIFLHGETQLCYTFHKRSGFAFGCDHISFLKSIEPIMPDAAAERDTLRVKALANRIFPGVWDDLREKITADPDHYYQNYGYTVTSITSKFPSYVLDRIKEAFEKKERYTYRTEANGHQGRSLSVEMHYCDDSIYRAWFTSEFPGCANGDYWLLLNPTTAAFKERD